MAQFPNQAVQKPDGTWVYIRPDGSEQPFTPGPAGGDSLWSGIKGAVGGLPVVGGAAKDALGLVTPTKADTSMLDAAQDRAFGTQDFFRDQLVGFGGEYDPWRADALARGGSDAIGMFRDAAGGKAPSVAQLMLDEAGARNAAGAFGLATALQSRSPGGALTKALQAKGAADAQTQRDLSMLRAKEMADARAGLVSAVKAQQDALAQQRGQDIDWRRTLVSADVGALGAGVDAARGKADAEAKAAAAENQYKGAIGGGLVSGALGIFSGGGRR